MRNSIFALLACSLMLVSCGKERLKLMYSQQETRIENFVKANLAKVEGSYDVKNKGSVRLVLEEGAGEPLSPEGSVTFLYAAYQLTGTTLSASSMFATNNKDLAAEAAWTVTGAEDMKPLTLSMKEEDIVPGLSHGLEGVKAGQECVILFSGKYGFGKKPLGTIPANAALAYYVWVLDVKN